MSHRLVRFYGTKSFPPVWLPLVLPRLFSPWSGIFTLYCLFNYNYMFSRSLNCSPRMLHKLGSPQCHVAIQNSFLFPAYWTGVSTTKVQNLLFFFFLWHIGRKPVFCCSWRLCDSSVCCQGLAEIESAITVQITSATHCVFVCNMCTFWVRHSTSTYPDSLATSSSFQRLLLH